MRILLLSLVITLSVIGCMESPNAPLIENQKTRTWTTVCNYEIDVDSVAFYLNEALDSSRHPALSDTNQSSYREE